MSTYKVGDDVASARSHFSDLHRAMLSTRDEIAGLILEMRSVSHHLVEEVQKARFDIDSMRKLFNLEMSTIRSLVKSADESNQKSIEQQIAQISYIFNDFQTRSQIVTSALARGVSGAIGWGLGLPSPIYLGQFTALAFIKTGHRIYVDTRSLDIGSHILTLGDWEPTYASIFQQMVNIGDVVFDLGANIGFYTLLAASKVGLNGEIHSFEPNPRLYELLTASVVINGVADIVRLSPTAVGENEGLAELIFSDSWSGGGSLLKDFSGLGDSAQKATCRVESIDEYWRGRERSVDVIKMDIEGFEGYAIRGMRQIIRNSPSLKIMMEYSPEMLRTAGTSSSELAEFFDELQFRIWDISPEGRLVETDWECFVAMTAGVRNVVICRTHPLVDTA
jgi:FkbM family methyltransferase